MQISARHQTMYHVSLYLDEFELITLKNLMATPWHGGDTVDEDREVKKIRQALYYDLTTLYNESIPEKVS